MSDMLNEERESFLQADDSSVNFDEHELSDGGGLSGNIDDVSDNFDTKDALIAAADEKLDK